jgi:hypothetical protein
MSKLLRLLDRDEHARITRATTCRPTAQVGRGATDLEKRRGRRETQATALNRVWDPPENRRAA